MTSKELIKILKKDKKAIVCVKINGVFYPINIVEFSVTSDAESYVTITPRDIVPKQ